MFSEIIKIIEDARNKPYKLGTHDCLKLVCDCVKIQTGKDHWGAFKGYKNKRSALVTIARIAPSLRQAVSKVLDQEEQMPLMSQRGDICLFNDGEEHLGICIGSNIVVLGEKGLIHISITDERITCSWRIECQHL